MTGPLASLAGQLAVMVFPALVICAGAGDVLTRRIPNGLVLASLLAFVPFAMATAMPWWMVALYVATALLMLFAGYGLFLLGLIGGGDAKLVAAAGLWLGFPCVLPFLLLTALAGGVLAACMGLWFMAKFELNVRSHGPGAPSLFTPDLPYGFAIAIGAILTTPLTWWMRMAAGQHS